MRIVAELTGALLLSAIVMVATPISYGVCLGLGLLWGWTIRGWFVRSYTGNKL
jgi:hypothetical protein